jgi:hypothetical protein
MISPSTESSFTFSPVRFTFSSGVKGFFLSPHPARAPAANKPVRGIRVLNFFHSRRYNCSSWFKYLLLWIFIMYPTLQLVVRDLFPWHGKFVAIDLYQSSILGKHFYRVFTFFSFNMEKISKLLQSKKQLLSGTGISSWLRVFVGLACYLLLN